MKSLGLRFQIVLNLAVIMVAALLLIGIAGIKISGHFLLNQKIRQTEMLSLMLMDVLPSKVITSKEKSSILNSLVEAGDIKAFFFVNRQGQVFSYRRGFTEIKDYHDRNMDATLYDGNVVTRLVGHSWFWSLGEDLVYYSPWIENEVITGGVKLILPLNDIKRDLVRIWRVVLFYLIVDSFVIILFGVFLLSKSIIKPLRVLEKTAGKIAAGDLEDRVTLNREDEIGSLADSFNIMADTLQEKIYNLEKVNRNLVEAQESILMTEKMATIGRLAAGIAHEIGNPLGVVQGYLDILIKGVEKKEETDILKRLVKETKRINSIITNFLNISRPSRMELKVIDVNKVINEVIRFLKGSMKDIKLVLALNDDIPLARIDEGQLYQVLVNMVLNAVDAMPEGGRLGIETEETKLIRRSGEARRKEDPPYIDYTLLRRDKLPHTALKGEVRMVRITFTDTGTGIKEEDINKIFDPFFTTKETGKGTGLGLAISLGIVQAFGGEIKVKSRVGEGTMFEIFLPAGDNSRQ